MGLGQAAVPMPHPYNPPRSLSLSFPFGRGRQLHELVRGARHCEAPAWLDHVRPGTPWVEPPPGTFHPSGPPPRPPPDAPRVLAPGGLVPSVGRCRLQDALCELVQAKAVHSHVLSVPVPRCPSAFPGLQPGRGQGPLPTHPALCSSWPRELPAGSRLPGPGLPGSQECRRAPLPGGPHEP